MTLLSQYNSLFTFQLVMQSLYNGGCHNLSVEAGDVLELMKTLLCSHSKNISNSDGIAIALQLSLSLPVGDDSLMLSF